MTLPASIRINAQFPFPSLMIANGPVTVTKQNGIWTVGFSMAGLGGVPSNTPLGNIELLAFNTLTNTFQQISAAQVTGSLSTRTITATGAIGVITATDRVLLMNPTVAATCNIQLPASSARFGLGPLTVKDIQGFAAGNNISITPNGTDTIDNVNAAFVMNDNFECVTLNPLAAGGWWIG